MKRKERKKEDGSVLELLSSIYKALGLVPHTTKKETIKFGSYFMFVQHYL
jgi:hypothetical protein